MTHDQIRTFLQGGKATFTLESMKTGTYYTFRAIKKLPDMIWISLLVAPDEYEYLGPSYIYGNGMTYERTKKSPNNPKMHMVMEFFISRLSNNKDFEKNYLVFRHEGRCCVCNRPLTTPKSIDSGIGPVCAEKM